MNWDEQINGAIRDVAQLLDALDIRNNGRRDGATILCPWHNERRPSCRVQIKNGRVVAHCFACGSGAGAIGIAAAVWGLDAMHDYPEVCERLATQLGVQLDKGPARSALPKPVDPVAKLADRIDDAADAWIRGREVKDHAIEQASPVMLSSAMAELTRRDAQEAREPEPTVTPTRLTRPRVVNGREVWIAPVASGPPKRVEPEPEDDTELRNVQAAVSYIHRAASAKEPMRGMWTDIPHQAIETAVELIREAGIDLGKTSLEDTWRILCQRAIEREGRRLEEETAQFEAFMDSFEREWSEKVVKEAGE